MKKARSTVKKATFQSYIADNKALRSNSSHVKGNNDWEEEEEGADEGPPQPRLLPGELTVSHAEQVLRYTPYGDHKQGISGTLFCTNFKVTFITPNRPVDKVWCTSMLRGVYGSVGKYLNHLST
ncbi:hypothetical protein LSAT2_032147 [Lamellibrachia satsuma]|nr:hypothetical protein LSAT2_032147 [Lamellibrachia satsuma]